MTLSYTELMCVLVFLRLLERILERKLPRRAGGASKETLTLFQFWSYLEAEGVNDLDTHIPELAEEGTFEGQMKACVHGQ